jgi:hypothetical protein
MTRKYVIEDIEMLDGWTKQWSKDINEIKPEGYEFVQLPDGIRLYCAGPAYAGWLARHVDTLLFPFPKISFGYRLLIDDATQQQAEVVETDSKITDAAGWTYDLSAQWNITKKWLFQVDNKDWTWADTPFTIAAPQADTYLPVQIDYALDYEKHTSSIVSVIAGNALFRDMPSDLQNIPARQVEWQPSTIVMQMQQCNNYRRGAHSQKFQKITYSMEA